MRTLYVNRTNGFTLVEMAIVMLILGLLLAGLMTPLSTSLENQRRQETRDYLQTAHNALLGFAVIYSRMPCPDTNSDGIENSPCAGTTEGQLPWATLGLDRFDAWGNVIRYRVDSGFSTTPIANIPATLDGLAVQDRTATPLTVTNPDAPVAILYSCGGDGLPNAENDDDGAANTNRNCTNGAASNSIYTQDVYVRDQFDDLLIWVSKNTLIYRLVAAGKWPQ